MSDTPRTDEAMTNFEMPSQRQIRVAKLCAELELEIADLKRQLEEADEDDAERYRWLAKAGWIDDAIMKHYGIIDGDKDSLDAAIDATEQSGG